jgi:hypothetical protein
MIPTPFAYHRPRSVDEAIALWGSTARRRGSSPADTA